MSRVEVLMVYFPNCQSVRGKHWNPPCDYLVGTLVTLVTIFTTQSKTLFGGITSRRFCTCHLTLNIILPWYRNIQEYFTMVTNMWALWALWSLFLLQRVDHFFWVQLLEGSAHAPCRYNDARQSYWYNDAHQSCWYTGEAVCPQVSL